MSQSGVMGSCEGFYSAIGGVRFLIRIRVNEFLQSRDYLASGDDEQTVIFSEMKSASSSLPFGEGFS